MLGDLSRMGLLRLLLVVFIVMVVGGVLFGCQYRDCRYGSRELAGQIELRCREMSDFAWASCRERVEWEWRYAGLGEEVCSELLREEAH